MRKDAGGRGDSTYRSAVRAEIGLLLVLAHALLRGSEERADLRKGRRTRLETTELRSVRSTARAQTKKQRRQAKGKDNTIWTIAASHANDAPVGPFTSVENLEVLTLCKGFAGHAGTEVGNSGTLV
jgi:hypothetical protein